MDRMARRPQPKRQVAMPDELWEDVGVIANQRGASSAELVRQAVRFRVNYANAARRAKSADPKEVFMADPRLEDDLRRWCNGGGH
jgi:hypothetical protein